MPVDPAQWALVHAACFTTPRPWSAPEIAETLAASHVFSLGDSRGFLIGRSVAGESELLTLAVDPAWRRQGLGHHFVEGFLAQSRARHAQTAFLEVSAINIPAIALYHSAGFIPAGKRRGYYATPLGEKIDALVMTRAL